MPSRVRTDVSGVFAQPACFQYSKTPQSTANPCLPGPQQGRDLMQWRLLAGSALLMCGAAFAPQLSNAAMVQPAQTAKVTTTDSRSLVQEARHRGGRCVFWRFECADRWGWGSRKFYRCLWRHGC